MLASRVKRPRICASPAQVLVDDLERDAVVLEDAVSVVDDARASLAEHAEDLELLAELAPRAERRQRGRVRHRRRAYRASQAARIFGEVRTGSRAQAGSFDFHAAHAAAAAVRASSAT